MASTGSQMQKYQCPCGRSYFTVKRYHDKSGQFDEHWEMNCNHCKQRYQLSSFLKETDQGINEAYLWAPINIFSELAIVEGQLHRAQNDALALARELYLERWILHCCRGQTKRDVWRNLSDDGRREPGFALFDSLVNDLNMGDYLKDYFNYLNLDYILKKLRARDLRLEEMRGRAAALQLRLERVQGLMRMEGFAGQSEYLR
jgi:uncharacterized protein YutD